MGRRLARDSSVTKFRLTKNKLDWFKFQESRRVGYEGGRTGERSEDGGAPDCHRRKEVHREEFDEGARNTGEPFFRQLTADLAAATDSAQALATLCDEKFGRDAPNFANLKKAIEDLQDAVREFWKPAGREGTGG